MGGLLFLIFYTNGFKKAPLLPLKQRGTFCSISDSLFTKMSAGSAGYCSKLHITMNVKTL